MSPSKLPDYLYEPGWTTPDYVGAIATVSLSPRAWKPTAHLDEITHDDPTDEKTKRVLRMPCVAGGQKITATEVDDDTSHVWRFTRRVATNGHDILQAEGIIPVPDDLLPAGSTNQVDAAVLLAGGFDLAAYPIGTMIYERLMNESREIFETLRRYDPRFTVEFDPSRVQLSLSAMEVASTVLVRRGIDPVEVLRTLATLAGLRTSAVDKKRLMFKTKGRADGDLVVYVKEDIEHSGADAPPYYALRIEPRPKNDSRRFYRLLKKLEKEAERDGVPAPPGTVVIASGAEMAAVWTHLRTYHGRRIAADIATLADPLPHDEMVKLVGALLPQLNVAPETKRRILAALRGTSGNWAFPLSEFKNQGLRKKLQTQPVTLTTPLGFELRLPLFESKKLGRPKYLRPSPTVLRSLRVSFATAQPGDLHHEPLFVSPHSEPERCFAIEIAPPHGSHSPQRPEDAPALPDTAEDLVRVCVERLRQWGGTQARQDVTARQCRCGPCTIIEWTWQGERVLCIWEGRDEVFRAVLDGVRVAKACLDKFDARRQAFLWESPVRPEDRRGVIYADTIRPDTIRERWAKMTGGPRGPRRSSPSRQGKKAKPTGLRHEKYVWLR